MCGEYVNICLFLGAFAKMQKATVSFALSVCLSVRMEQLSSHWAGLHENLYLSVI
jgi:hypothetical protein